jgi:hypothetical protein
LNYFDQPELMRIREHEMANELIILSGTNSMMDLTSSQTSEEVAQCLAAQVDRILEDYNIEPIVFIDECGNPKEVRFSSMHGVQISDANLCELTTLSLSAAEALANYHTELLELDGLIEVSADVARCLAAREGGLSLQGVAKIDADTAKALATHKDHETELSTYGLYLELREASSEVIDALSKKVGSINDMPASDYCAQLRTS